jgi:hypothetical protein
MYRYYLYSVPRSFLMFNVIEIDTCTTQLLDSLFYSSVCHIFALSGVKTQVAVILKEIM